MLELHGVAVTRRGSLESYARHAACSKFFRDKRSDKRQGGINYTWHLGALGMADWLRAKRAAIIIALGNCLAAISGKFGDSLTLKVERGMQWPICLCSATLQLLASTGCGHALACKAQSNASPAHLQSRLGAAFPEQPLEMRAPLHIYMLSVTIRHLHAAWKRQYRITCAVATLSSNDATIAITFVSELCVIGCDRQLGDHGFW